MRTAFLLFFASCCAVQADDTALVRPNGADYEINVHLVRNRPAITSSLPINLVRSTDDADVIVRHWEVPATDIASKSSGTSIDLRFSVSLPRTLFDKTASYKIAIPIIPVSEGLATRAEIDLSRGLAGKILADVSNGFCPGGVMIALTGDNLVEQDWRNIDTFFGQRETDPNTGLKLRVGSAGNYVPMAIRTLVRQTRSLVPVLLGATYSVCLNTIHQLPMGSFNAILEFGSGTPAPLPLLSKITGADLDGRQTPSMKHAAAPPGEVGDRSLERNLDLGLAYTQSRNRKTRETSRLGALDLRFAPLLDVQRRMGKQFLSQQTIPSWYWFLTPLYIDANISTGQIVDNTVSLNRISMGPQLELRYMKLRSDPADATNAAGLVPLPRYPNVHRFIVFANHNSDRDFKQLEYVGKFEYQPLLGIWNRPRETRWKSVADPVTRKAVALEPIGWRIVPRFGVELGNTYRSRTPAEAIEVSDFVRRGYGGLDVTLEVSDYLAFTVSDTAYIRGEIAPTHLVNYLKLEADFPIGSPFRETAQSFFLNYERGTLPPFYRISAKTLRLGYRVRSENWFGFRR